MAYWLMMALLFAGLASAAITVFVIHLIPTWVLLLLAALAVLLNLPSLLKARKRNSVLELQQSFQKPMEIATGTALFAHFVSVRAAALLVNLKWF